MDYSISTYTLFALPIQLAVEALIFKGGWKSIEIMGEGKYHGRLLLNMEKSEIQTMARQAKENGVSFGFHLPIEGFNPASPDEETERIWKKCLSAAEMLEVEYVLFHLGSNPSIDGGLKSAADFSRKMLQELPEKTRLVIENVPVSENAVGTSMDQLVSVMQMIKDPRAGIMLDTGHCYMNAQARFLDECRKAYPHLFGLHINDNHGSSDEHLQIGEGTIPFPPLLEELKGRPIQYVFETNTVARAESSMNLIKINNWGMQGAKHSIT